MHPAVGSPSLVSFPATLHRHGQNPVPGLAQLFAGSRPSFEIVADTPYPLSLFKVALARRVNPKTYGRDVQFTLPIAPFDACRLVFKEVEHTTAFYQKLLELDAAVPVEPPAPNIIFRKNSASRDRPRPLSAFPGTSQAGVKPSLNFKPRPAEAPASLVPPPPPKRGSSLSQDGKSPILPPPPSLPNPASPRSSSLPSTSSVLPGDFRNSRSLEPSDLTLVPNTPTPPTPVTPMAPNPFFAKPKKADFNLEDDGLEAFYPEDITLIRHLERGSQGTVDLVSTKFYRRVALKNFDRRVRQWEAAATRELCSLLKTVTHPNIVQSRGVLFASLTQKDKPIGVLMEYMDCGSVHTAIYDLSLTQSPTTPLNWCRQAASALAFLHRRRLVHRDVKPANMLLCDGGKKLKISDFGLCAKVDSGMTADVGTVVYMAPEVVASHSTRAFYDEKCDVYSLGISLWEMVHRRRPHDGVGFLALMSAVKDGSRPSIDSRICSPQLSRLIQRMWAENSKDRPDMEEVHEEVNKMLDTLGFFDIYE